MTASPLRRGNWSVQEMQRMRALLPRRGVVDTARLLRRTADSVRRKALELFTVKLRRTAWTPDDDMVLREAWGALEPRLLAALLGRTTPELHKRALQLRGKFSTGPWTREEDQLLKQYYGTRRDEDLELCLLRPKVEIDAAALRLCLSKDKRFSRASLEVTQKMPRWTPAEIQILKSIYPGRENIDVARALKRTVASVANKANQLGLKKSFEVLAKIGRTNVSARYEDA